MCERKTFRFTRVAVRKMKTSKTKLTWGSRLISAVHGGAGGDGQSSDTYEPNSSQSLRNDDDFGGYS